jgi:hypothetical protein
MAVDAFIPTLWSKKFKDVLDPALVYANCVNRDYEGEIKNMGDTVRVNTIGPVTISPYVTNTLNLLPEQIQGAGQPMVIDQANYFYFALDDVNKAQINVNVMEQAIRRASFGMRDVIDEFLSALLAAGVHEDNVLEVTGTTSSSVAQPILLPAATPDLCYELLVDLSTRLNKANVPGGDRWAVLPPDFVGRMLKDDRFTSFATSGSFENIKGGSSAGGEDGNLLPMLRMLTGFDIYVSNQVPVGGATVYTIIAGYKGAASFATQIAEGQPEAFRLQTGFADAVRGLQLYGGKVFEPAGLASAYIQFT